MNVGKGHWIFAVIFLVIFVIGMVWAYRRDKPVDKANYKGTWGILFFMFLVLFLVYLFVKLKTS